MYTRRIPEIDCAIQNLKKQFDFKCISATYKDDDILVKMKMKQNQFLAYKLKNDILLETIHKEFYGILIPHNCNFGIDFIIEED